MAAGTPIVDPRPVDHEAVLRAVYGADPAFVHPDVGFLRRVLSGRAAYLRHGTARAFALRGDAFAVAFVDPRLQHRTGRPIGSIGFLEATSQDAAGGVLDAACDWLRSHGVQEAWTPFNGNTFFGVGLREDRFGEPPFVGCAHQPSSLCSWLEVAGFRRVAGYRNYEIDLTGNAWRGPSSRPPAGVSFRTAVRRRFREEVATFMDLHNAAFQEVWGESEFSREEALELMGRARLAIPPSLFQFAVADGREVGMVLCMPDVNEVLAPQRRTLTSPSGVWKMAARRRKVRSAGLLAVGLDPAWQGRGIGTALVARACEEAARLGFERVEYALVAESNDASKSTVARFGGKLCRTFGVYAKQLTAR
ncbi:MAG: GNAT family N-acetyltransferase [Actinomycetota bacterium]|nr:GNAT family N-acetyltransferase [Actinomycetota bacterium]